MAVLLQNIQKMKEQLAELGCLFDWDREVATCEPTYYRWTQWIFLRMYQEGLVYQKVTFQIARLGPRNGFLQISI
jgi:leucyl-tRNA synthetase